MQFVGVCVAVHDVVIGTVPPRAVGDVPPEIAQERVANCAVIGVQDSPRVAAAVIEGVAVARNTVGI